MKFPLILLLFFALSTDDTNGQNKHFGKRSLSATVLANNTGPGFGLQYEHFSKSDKLSWVLPVSFCFSYVSKSKSYHGTGSPTGEDLRPLMVFFNPGFRFYPTRSSGVARYSIGLSLMIATGKGEGHTYTNGTNNLEPRGVGGLLLTNAINFHLSPHIRTCLEVGLGVGTDSGVNSAAGPDVINPLGQLSFSLGYRW